MITQKVFLHRSVLQLRSDNEYSTSVKRCSSLSRWYKRFSNLNTIQ